MDLFDHTRPGPKNLLPKDGTALYFGPIMGERDADQYFTTLLHTIDWRQDQVVLFGRKITTRRKVAWYGEKPYTYHYSNLTRTALLFTETLIELKSQVEKISAETYNSCLLNLYHDGTEGISWHSDAETDLKPEGAIASVSLGAQRKFVLRHKQSQETISQELAHGSLLVMSGPIQTHWQHRLATSKKILSPRINLTFRTIVD